MANFVLIAIRLDEIGLNANVCIEHIELLFKMCGLFFLIDSLPVRHIIYKLTCVQAYPTEIATDKRNGDFEIVAIVMTLSTFF